MQTQATRTLLTLPLLFALASPVLAEDDKALLAQCDINKNGAIDTAEMYGFTTRAAYRTADPKIKEAVSKEWNCKMDYELAKGKAELAKGKAESARLDDETRKMIQILAMLRPAEARTFLAEEISRLEGQISAAKAANSAVVVELSENRLNILRKEQQKLK